MDKKIGKKIIFEPFKEFLKTKKIQDKLKKKLDKAS
jgi:hypothetical protein